MSTVKETVQSLEPGTVIALWEVDATAIGGDIARFHANSEEDIVWQGLTYSPWPIKGEGFAMTSDQQPQPKLLVGNLDGSITSLCLLYEDMLGALVTRRRTFVQFLDAVNFPGGNPNANPSEEYLPEQWYVERKVTETAEVVEFQLASALDFMEQKLPARQIVADQCPAQWVYRGENCGYTGPAVADINDNPTADIALDRCGKRLSSCKLRQWPDNVLNFGGFPAAGLVRT